MALVNHSEFREVLAARTELRPLELGREYGSAQAAARQHSILLSDDELEEVLRGRRSWPHGACRTAPSPRTQSPRRDGTTSRENFNDVAHLFHPASNRATVSWEVSLRGGPSFCEHCERID